MTTRRAFLKTSMLGAGALALPAGALATTKKLRWRCALAIPKTLAIWGPGMERFARQVEVLTAGNFKITIFGAGELIPALGTFEAVMNGDLEAGGSAAYYWIGKVPASAYFTSVPFGMTVDGLLAWLEHGGGQQLYDELMHPYGVTCLPCGATGFQMAGWFNREINLIEDLKGLKIRIPGIAGQVYAKLGAVPVLIPGGEIFTSLSTGVVDAVEWVGPYHDYLLGLHRAASYYYGPGWQEPGPLLELMLNLKAWQTLPEQYQLAIRVAAADTTRWMMVSFQAKNAEYLTRLKANSAIEIRSLPERVLHDIKEVSNNVLEEVANSSAVARKIHTSYTTFQRELEQFSAISGNLSRW